MDCEMEEVVTLRVDWKLNFFFVKATQIEEQNKVSVVDSFEKLEL